MKNNKILIVDSMSGGRFFPEIAKREFGVESIHLLSSDSLPEYYKSAFSTEVFKECYVWSEKEHSLLLETFKLANVTTVIAGTETGVELADRISEDLKILTNGKNLSRARRSKTLMHSIVSQYGVRVPTQTTVKSVDEGIEFVKRYLKYPVVIKPDDSAGTDGFYVVDSEESFREAFGQILNQPNKLGAINSRLIIQEFIKGEEFAVNTVSVNGKHFITHIWHYHKKIIESGKIYDWEEYIQFDSDLAKAISEFTYKTLDALGIKFGAAHTEVMLDEKGLVLIETASRVDGMCNPHVDDQCLGVNQVHLSLMSYLDPESVELYIKSNLKKSGFLANVSLISKCKTLGEIENINLEFLKNLKSFKDIRLSVKIGETLSETKDIFSSPGFVYMFNDSKEAIYQDYLKIREIESKNLIFQTKGKI